MNHGKTSAKRTFRLATAALCFGLIAAAPQAQAAGGDTVRSFYDTLLANMRGGTSLGVRPLCPDRTGGAARIRCIPFMTRLAVGRNGSLTEAQRQQVSQAFRALCRRSLRRALR
jgi:hypothetical protein